MFHVMKPVNEKLNKVRKQTRMTLKGSKFILLKNGVDLTEEQKVKLADILKHQDLRNWHKVKRISSTILH